MTERLANIQSETMSALSTRRVLEDRVPDGPILLHGGGNFGDRWPAYQRFREKVMADLPHRTIIQLPQTIDFASENELARVQSLYSAHPDLTLMIRDHPGYEQARGWFPDNNVVYCPDSAFGMGPVAPVAEPTHDIVVLKRADRESVHADQDVFDGAHQTDWHVSAVGNLTWWPVTLIGMLLHQIPPLRGRLHPRYRRTFDWQADIVINGAVEILSRGRIIVTDRLHAAILATLMGKPVVMVDNVNKKISTIYRELLADLPNTHLADSFTDADRLAASMIP
ncbi:MAG: polysaccharide pyruvyl transferase family protein [Rhodococcus sp. (in: high G+C Gram-positive bacteria)]|uniref:polysaccharide pyruvyl transferase family protein n=1 Tax=Rhodococcus sp. TaxID=1831 RepID=UPI003BB0CDB5